MSRNLGLALIGGGLLLMAAAAFAGLAFGSDTIGRPEFVESQLMSGASEALVPPSGAAAQTDPSAVPTDPPLTAQVSSDGAATTLSEAESSSVPIPVGLRIGAISVDAPVDPYGVDLETREMAVPDNVTDVAWYKFGPAPGAPGSAVMAAHVDLFGQGPGVFFDLGRLEVGDVTHVSYADGTERAFRVVARTIYEKDELPTEAMFAKEGPAVLTLVTCGGGFSRSDRSYDSNVVVYAVPLGGAVAIDGVPG